MGKNKKQTTYTLVATHKEKPKRIFTGLNHYETTKAGLHLISGGYELQATKIITYN